MKKQKIIQIFLMVAVLLMVTACSGKKDTKTTDAEETKENKKIEISFPYALDEERLLVNSLFQSSIENPDCDNEYADDIASLEIVNQSGKYLESAEITVHMSDDTELHMSVADVPSEQKVWVFDNQNQVLSSDATCISIECDAKYLDEVPLMKDQVVVEVNETTVTLLNQSEETLSGLTVECHCIIDGVYYGGLTYSYPAEDIMPNGSVVIEAEDCFLGTADVVRLSK
ncbi:hypothetical protein ABE547_09970 [Dorea sp. YH-dor226]|uniref:hypothetical protein n=1 Tax=Dorea sp. YH-dor226 TaxID=3151119 RepID=UPI003241FA6A